MVSETLQLHMQSTSLTYYQWSHLFSQQFLGTLHYIISVIWKFWRDYKHICLYCRIEKLRLNSKAGKFKTLGAIICAVGAVTTSLYKGKSFHMFHNKLNPKLTENVVSKAHWTRGSLLLVGSCLSYASWYIVQVIQHSFYIFYYNLSLSIVTLTISKMRRRFML